MLFRRPKSNSQPGRGRAAKRRTRLDAVSNPAAAEVLEQRVLLAGVVDDGFEDNDLRSRATNFGMTAPAAFAGLQMRDGSDWYTFSMQGTGTASDYVAIGFEHGFGNLNLEIYDVRGAILTASTGSTNRELISLNGFAEGTYFVQVVGVGGAQNSYAMAIDPASLPVDDGFENNDTFASAKNFGTLAGGVAYAGLRMADGADFYRFRFDGPSSANSFVQVRFWQAQGDLDVDLYNAAGTLVRRSVGQGNGEEIALAGLAPGEYAIKVSGYQGVLNPYYDLLISPYHSTAPTSGNRVLYVNFDGISVSNATLRSWSSGDWDESISSYIDPEGNGVVVKPYEQTHPQRVQIINGIIANLKSDLAPFGITVQRASSAQVLAGATAGQGATTLFFGLTDVLSTISVPTGVAGDIDYANNNKTDIAFINDAAEFWGDFGFSVSDAILNASDVALHEAGHTFGLHHVRVGQFGTLLPESMGLAYSAFTLNDLIADTSFLDADFPEYIDHGSRFAGDQNTYETMLAHFGRSANAQKKFDLPPGVAQQELSEHIRGPVYRILGPNWAAGSTAGSASVTSSSWTFASQGSSSTALMAAPSTGGLTVLAPTGESKSVSGQDDRNLASTGSTAGSTAVAVPTTLDSVFAELSTTGGLYA